MPTKTPPSDLRIAVIALAISLMTCMGVHGLAGCAAQPAYTVSVQAAVASDDDLLPKTGRYSPPTAASSGAKNEAKPPTTQPTP